MSSMEFAMVLSGGGGKGAYQAGAFDAIAEYPIRITSISGSSIGAINGYAYILFGVEMTNRLWDDFSTSDFFHFDETVGDALSSQDRLRGVLEKASADLPDRPLKDKIPLYATICNDRGRAEYVKLNDKYKDEIIELILASSAMPIIYPTVEINGEQYQDGGVADNLPVMPLFLDDARNLISVSVSPKLTVNQYKFPMDALIEIVPSKDLGGIFDGTFNFSESQKAFAKKLGYYDAKRALNAFFGESNYGHSVEEDHAKIRQELKVDATWSHIDSTMDKLSKYL